MKLNNETLATKVAAGNASLEDMASLGGDAVASIKSNPELLQIRHGASEIITKAPSKRQITYLVSDETPDRVGDIIQVSGWDLKSYKANPVVLWAHDGTTVPPIGRSQNVRRRYSPTARLTADIEFAPAEAHQFADTIYQLADRGFIKATSVGFMPQEVLELDDKQRKKLGLGKYGQVFSKSELMEISVVAVPANPAALELGMKQLIKDGVLEKSLVPNFLDIYPKDEETASRKVRALCRSFVDFGALNSMPKETQTPMSHNEEDPVEKAIPEAVDPALEEKSPACRQDGESKEECVERKIPELIEEGMEQDQAVAVANGVCEEACSEKSQAQFMEAMASLIEQQAAQTKATRQLVDALSDLTKSLETRALGGTNSDELESSDVAVPEAKQFDSSDFEEVMNDRLRGFADGVRRDLLNNNNNQNTNNV